jgi:hypothetical protein
MNVELHANRILVRKPEEKTPLDRTGQKGNDTITKKKKRYPRNKPWRPTHAPAALYSLETRFFVNVSGTDFC